MLAFCVIIPGMIETIALNTHWRCTYAEQMPDGGIDGFDVAALTAFDPRSIEGKLAWLERSFDLPVQDVCINYQLEIDYAPRDTHLFLNGRAFGEIATPFRLDVTDMVALEDNQILFRVAHNAFGGFGPVRLIAIPCEQ